MERRRFLRYAATLPVLTIGACRTRRKGVPDVASSAAAAQRCAVVEQRKSASGRVLRAHEWETLEAVTGRILPSDDEAGALEAGAINYIDAQLADPPVAAFLPLMRAGVRYLTARSRHLGKRSFAALSPAQQDGLMRQLQSGSVGGRWGGRFMRVMVVLTLEGLFSDPVYGGNQQEVGWKLIGFQPQEPRPRCPYKGRRQA